MIIHLKGALDWCRWPLAELCSVLINDDYIIAHCKTCWGQEMSEHKNDVRGNGLVEKSEIFRIYLGEAIRSAWSIRTILGPHRTEQDGNDGFVFEAPGLVSMMGIRRYERCVCQRRKFFSSASEKPLIRLWRKEVAGIGNLNTLWLQETKQIILQVLW